MRPRAWSLAAACALALLAVVALVSWRGPDVATAWSGALRTTAVLAVVALALAVLVCGAVALLPPPPDRVSIALPPDAPPATTVAPHPGPGRWLVAALVLAVLGTVPVLLVLVLSATGAASAAPGPAGGPVVTSTPPPPSSPSPDGTATPTTSPGTGPDTSPSTTSAPVTPSSTSAPGTTSKPPPSGSPPPPPQPPTGNPDGAAASPPLPGCTAVVVPGDTLWDLALVRLLPGATPSQVAAATRALYAANVGVVGADPDLILPGQVLETCG